jgi:parallel beta-helix repeat protein
MVLSSVCHGQIRAQSQGDIIINTDGSISPSSAPIHQTGDTYTMTSNMEGNISVEKKNITLDGNANVLIGGLLLKHGSNVTVKNFIIKGGEQFGEVPRGFFAGIYLSDTSNVVVANNTITGISNFLATYEYYETVAGIIVAGGRSNVISGNNLVNNFQGLEFKDTTNNLIVGNNITYSLAAEKEQGYNDPAGIFFDHASNNTIYHNNFEISIGRQAGDSYYDSVNIWDDGYPSGGNYWTNYNAKQIDMSGIGDSPYTIDYYNTDRYPLMEPFNTTFFALQTTPPKISIESPTEHVYNESSILLVFSVEIISSNKTVSWTGYSLDDQENVTIIGICTLTNMTNGFHSIFVYTNDTFGNMGASTVNFTVAKLTVAKLQPFLTVIALAVISTSTVALIIGVGVLIYFRHKKR